MIIIVILKQKTVKRHIYKMIYYVSFVKIMLNGRYLWLVSFLFIKRLAHEKTNNLLSVTSIFTFMYIDYYQ